MMWDALVQSMSALSVFTFQFCQSSVCLDFKAAHAKQLLREYMETNHVIGVSRMATQQQLSFKAVKKGDSNRKHSKTAVIPVQTRSYKGSTPGACDLESLRLLWLSIPTCLELDDKEIQHKLNILKEFDHTVEFGPSIGENLCRNQCHL